MSRSISIAISDRNGRSYDSHGESSKFLEIFQVLVDNGEELPVRAIYSATPSAEADILKYESLTKNPVVGPNADGFGCNARFVECAMPRPIT
jgi:hypothetical protein